MANDPNRYAKLALDWNMGPFYMLVDGAGGDLVGGHLSEITLYRKVGPHFFENAKAKGQVVRQVTITLVGPPIE